MSKRLTLVLGGARAGKSTYAEELAKAGDRVLFVATAEALDEEMTTRIQAHKQGRPSEWDTLEEPLHLVPAMKSLLPDYDTVLLDCVTLWVTNLLVQDRTPESVDIPAEARNLLDLYRDQGASWIVVSNEVGLGLVATTKLGRLFTDELGRVNQMVAAEADEVIFMAAGLPLTLKSGHPAD